MIKSDGTYFIFCIFNLAQRIFMIFEIDLCKVMNTRYPKNFLVRNYVFSDFWNTCIALRIALQDIRYQFLFFSVIVAERTAIWDHPKCVMLIFHDEIFFADSTQRWILLVCKQPFLLQCVRIDDGYSHTICECP